MARGSSSHAANGEHSSKREFIMLFLTRKRLTVNCLVWRWEASVPWEKHCAVRAEEAHLRSCASLRGLQYFLFPLAICEIYLSNYVQLEIVNPEKFQSQNFFFFKQEGLYAAVKRRSAGSPELYPDDAVPH